LPGPASVVGGTFVIGGTTGATTVLGADGGAGLTEVGPTVLPSSRDETASATSTTATSRAATAAITPVRRDRRTGASGVAGTGAAGVNARANFSCCGSCASGEIWGERDDSRHWQGYAYFHQQDTDRLVADGETYIGYGAFPPEDFDEDTYDALSEAAKEDLYKTGVTRLLDDVIFPVFRRHGIEPEWNRDLGTRVLLKNADWYDPIEA
jgi:hypothetical protein